MAGELDTRTIDEVNTSQEEPQQRALPGIGSGKTPVSVTIFMYAFLLALAAFIVYQVIKRQAKSGGSSTRDDKMWERIREICHAKGLSGNEERVLVSALKAIGTSKPEEAITKESYFNAMVSPDLSRRAGEKPCLKIRNKLFGKKEATEIMAGGTRDFMSGQKIRLHFSGHAGNFACTIINVSDNGFVVTLPASGDKRIRPRKQDKVEGFIDKGNALCSFETAVEETFFGGVFACRLSHSADFHQIHERQAQRVRVWHPIIFGHFPGSNITDNQIGYGVLEDNLVARWEGILTDISPNGCAINTESSHHFQIGDFVQTTIQIVPDEPGQTVLGAILHINPYDDAEKLGFTLHVQFLGLDEDAENSLNRTILSLKKESENNLKQLLQ